jgi:hypothetical protein
VTARSSTVRISRRIRCAAISSIKAQGSPVAERRRTPVESSNVGVIPVNTAITVNFV